MALSDKNRQALTIGSIFGVAILIIIVYMGFTFVQPNIREYEDNAQRLRTEMRQNRETLRQYTSFLEDEESRRRVEEVFYDVAARLPESQDPIEIYELFREYLEGTDVALSFLDPGDPVRRTRFTEYPYTIRGSARYHEFGQFVNLIECNPQRLMRVTDFRLTNNPRRPSIHPMEVGITTFTFNEH